jgi:two-component system, OmpR family, osmolarity sensor histidine kinase EnvZ
MSATNPHQLLVLMIFTSLLMTLIAFVFMRNQLRPITKLAAAAEDFGKGRTVPYRPRGALEVRAAGRAFLDMRARIERQIEQRTLMLSGVSHDLRTPLTRPCSRMCWKCSGWWTSSLPSCGATRWRGPN